VLIGTDFGQATARRGPTGISWRPTYGSHGFGRDTEQLCGLCLWAAASKALHDGQSQHEERRGVLG